MIKSKSTNVVWHEGKVTCEERRKIIKQRGLVVWLTGLSGSGKSTIAVEVEKALIARQKLVYRLDGDNIRHGLNSDLGFSEEDRHENIRRIIEVAALLKDAGLITLVSFITPYRKMRELARGKIGARSFIEVYVKADISICAQRDPKQLYKKAKKGELADFTGMSSPFEEPDNPDLIIETDKQTVKESTHQLITVILDHLKK